MVSTGPYFCQHSVHAYLDISEKTEAFSKALHFSFWNLTWTSSFMAMYTFSNTHLQTLPAYTHYSILKPRPCV